ncbi:glycerate kinase [Gracilibacillus salitolerans]|uniref:Glycerate kinase n=1 Tax=Gracilibacillus salitolerans TaxID=2663022 RepID=A0A5Q2TIG9_9BACI|nr:glycerate kinase [Gracilibacillus salitolerans]QGH33917.1 glycerate kinase [Gracilibacillus salitolerans]
MKIVVAPDSYKGSLSATEVAHTIKTAIQESGDHEVITKPMADGGEGTIEAILSATSGKQVQISTLGPLGESIETSYAIINQTTAVIETAMHAGLYQVPDDKRNPDLTTTYGMGQAILDALDRGCQQIIIGLGGSATNDGGLGLLQALGLHVFDKNGNPLDKFGNDLLHIDAVQLDDLDPRLQDVKFRIACDVDNPLCGELGASAVYGPQKGATPAQIHLYDKALHHFANLLETQLDNNWQHTPGAGAAGGLGFAFLSLGAKLESGASLIAEAISLEQSIEVADLILTGEGQSDEQTLYGKAPGFVAELAKKFNKPTILLSGSLGGNTAKLRKHFAGCFSIVNQPLSLEECMDNTSTLLKEQTMQIMTLIQAMKEDR